MARQSAKKEQCKVCIVKDGPYLVTGGLPLAKETIIPDAVGNPAKWENGEQYEKQQEYSLCRCGHSNGKPFCDGSHADCFDGTETATKKPYAEQAETLKGPGMELKDAAELCAAARFCHRAGSVWRLTRGSDDPKSKKIAIQEACDCPSGRLVAVGKNGKSVEPPFKPSISLVEDPQNGVSGPIWVKGGVPVQSSDGTFYETRNRVTLCRCGRSSNKPFCDGTHISAKFSDGDDELK